MNTKHTCIPGDLFAHPPADLKKRLASKGVLDAYTYSIMNQLYSYVDFNQKTFVMEIEDDDGSKIDIYSYTGVTCQVSYSTLSDGIMSHRKANDAVKTLKEAGFLKIKPGSKKASNKANIYQITIYDDLIEDMKSKADKPRFKKLLALEAATSKIQAHIESAGNESDSGMHTVHMHDIHMHSMHTNDMKGMHTVHCKAKNTDSVHAPHASYQDINNLEGPPGGSQEAQKAKAKTKAKASQRQKPFERDDRQGASRLSEQKSDLKKSPPPSEPISESDTGDVVPNSYIANVIDSLVQSKSFGNHASEPISESDTGSELEKYLLEFNPNLPAVVQYKDQEAAKHLIKEIKGLLQQSSLDIPPLSFFKHCVKETKRRVEAGDNQLESYPVSLNFFTKSTLGQSVMRHCVKKLQHTNSAINERERTNDYLTEMRHQHNQRASTGDIPETAKAQLDKLLGRARL